MPQRYKIIGQLARVLAIILLLLVMSQSAWARTVKPGTVIKSTTGSTLYFVTPAESLAGIPSREVYECLRLSKQSSYNMGQEKIDALKKTKLLLKSNQGKTYLIEGTKKRHIVSPAVFKKKGFDQGDVFTISQSQLDCITNGKPLK
jgi:hypothetical protein